ncbi:hypothetical protein MERGE_000274 [Pneumocystis wakefieldiae]|uniref:Mitochondrial pyruvate carrier n=1 Tax=Pneumocystis wakefieldiae TaxID=38082 RepID=A0A899FXY2_9ASCO|nr:hypothetical protein MERGE_000274 [Pneumocystis wakefieldiae]
MSSFASTAKNKFSRFLNHPSGLKTVHFWAPAMKWGLVLAGIGDLKRSSDKLSVSQNIGIVSLVLGGGLCSSVDFDGLYMDPVEHDYQAEELLVSCIKHSLEINGFRLATVNLFLAITGGIQLLRIYSYRQGLKRAGS